MITLPTIMSLYLDQLIQSYTLSPPTSTLTHEDYGLSEDVNPSLASSLAQNWSTSQANYFHKLLDQVQMTSLFKIVKRVVIEVEEETKRNREEEAEEAENHQDKEGERGQGLYTHGIPFIEQMAPSSCTSQANDVILVPDINSTQPHTSIHACDVHCMDMSDLQQPISPLYNTSQIQQTSERRACPTSLLLLRERIAPPHVISLILLSAFHTLVLFPSLYCDCKPHLLELHRLAIQPLLAEDKSEETKFEKKHPSSLPSNMTLLANEIRLTSLKLQTIANSFIEEEKEEKSRRNFCCSSSSSCS